jgi:uncharacterized protein YbjQ (UPF0145 family)
MNRRVYLICLALSSCLAANTYARDDKLMLPIAQGLAVQGKTNLDPSIKLLFGTQKSATPSKTFGNFMTNKKTNAVGRSDEEACNWAFLSAMLELQERAKKEGGNAVINITSFYKKNEVISETQFECGAGAMMAGVTFKGDVVTLP